MEKIKRVKIKLKFKNIFKVLLLAIIVFFIVYALLNKRINNIYISGNNLLKEQDVLETIGFENYLKYYQINTGKIEKRLKTNSIIEKVKVKKNFFSITIELSEYKALWYQEHNQSIMLSNGQSIVSDDNILGLPSLINEIDEQYGEEDFVYNIEDYYTVE